MGKMHWSPEQLLAINEDGKNIIVSAGAGSGKTAVLSERVLRKLMQGVHINELLVLTFTNAAAAEMKERIRKKIKKEESLKEEANLIDGAYITTFDSFSLSIVKKYHTRLNITNNIGITDEVIISLKKKEILESIMNEYYENPTKEFTQLIEDFCLKDDKELLGYIDNVYKKIELKYDKTEYLNNFFNIELTNNKIDSYIEEYLNLIFERIEIIKKQLIDLNDYFDGDYISKVEDSINKLINAKNYNDVITSLDIKLPMVPKNSPEEGKRIKGVISDLIKEIKSYATYTSIDEMKEEVLSTINNSKVIIEIIKELDKRLEAYKFETEQFNFNDIARLAIKVVKENDDIREELSNSFNEILVDEYQDTSDTQETFINLIAHNNVYMVGDIKQSIYRFRNANPYIFKNKYDSYRDTDAGMKIDLLKNFRSRREVLDNINLLFDLFMDDDIGGADYKASHRMVFGNTAYEEKGSTNQNYNFELLTYDLDKKSNITRDEQEAFIIGKDILNKVNNKYQVFDKDEGILRDIEYSDFVILLDRSKNFDLYKKIFEYLGIPLNILKEESLRKDQDVLVLRNLFKLLICIKNKDYETDFKYSFTSVSRSYLYKISDEEIFDYFVNNNFYNSELFIKCSELVKNMDIMSTSEFVNYVLDEFNYEEKLLSIGNVKAFRVRIEYFYNLTKSYEETGKTIYDFVDYLDNIFDNEYDLKFNVNSNVSNSCKIMTIHKSKGLEFPICYFAGFQDKFNTNELKEKIIYDNKYGLILPKVDKYYKDTILKTLLKVNTKKEEISERIRLLYVAVTRAKEKMIFLSPTIEDEVPFIDDIVPSFERAKYTKFLDIIKSIYSNIIDYKEEVNVEATKDYQNNTSSTKELEKSSSNLEVKEISIDNNLVEEKHFSKESLHIVTKEEQDLLDFGTKVHEVLETLDFNNPNLSIYNLSKRMEDKINAFLNTELMLNNKTSNLYKEYEFTYLEDNVYSHGIIDLLIEREDKCIIVDYKLKNIDDPNYDKQLNGYRKYIMEKTKKEVECYLYSIIDEKYRRVND
ncbi:MAG: UvrD-helicase domain-containing protein [Bacilli bacterium]|nr:UvrD-helicase domain-containing protein [Bacilli bacterium]